MVKLQWEQGIIMRRFDNVRDNTKISIKTNGWIDRKYSMISCDIKIE